MLARVEAVNERKRQGMDRAQYNRDLREIFFGNTQKKERQLEDWLQTVLDLVKVPIFVMTFVSIQQFVQSPEHVTHGMQVLPSLAGPTYDGLGLGWLFSSA